MDEAAKAGRPVRLCENARTHQGLLSRLRRMAAEEFRTIGDGKTAVIDENQIPVSDSKSRRLVAIDGAHGGKAICLANDNWDWSTQFGLSQVAFDPGARFRLRVRAKVDLGRESGPVLSAGVYDAGASKSVLRTNFDSKAVKADWAWYDIGIWDPNDRQYIWIAPGAFDRARNPVSPAYDRIYIDELEISRVDR